MAGLNSILQIEGLDTYFNPGLNCLSILQAWEIFSMLVKDELTDCCKLVGELKNNDIIISILALKISFKVDEDLVDY